MKSLSLIELDSIGKEIEYSSKDNEKYPRIYANGKEIETISVATKSDLVNLSKKIITSGILKEQLNLMNIKGILNEYFLRSSYSNVLYDGTISKYNNENILYDLVSSFNSLVFTSRRGSEENDRNLVIIANSGNDGVINLPVIKHGTGYDKLLELVSGFIEIIGGESEVDPGWIRDMKTAMVVPMDAKPSKLADGVEDKTNLIREHQVVDYISFDSCKQNIGSSGISYPIGDPELIYKGAEINNPAYQFSYIDSNGNQEPIYWQKTSRVIQPDSIELVKEGSMIQLVLFHSLNMTEGVIFDNEPIKFSDKGETSNITYGYEDEKGSYDTVVVRAEEGLYNTDYFFIEISNKRLVIYPKEDYPEYRIESAILTNVI